MNLYVELLEAEVKRLRRKIIAKNEHIEDLKDKLDPTRAIMREQQRKLAFQMFNGLEEFDGSAKILKKEEDSK